MTSSTPMTLMTPMTRGAKLATAFACGLLSAAGCSFDSASQGVQRNTCSIAADCSAGARCEDGMCVGATHSNLELSLEVTPMRMPDGSQPVPIAFGPLSLDGPTQRKIELPLPAMTSGTVREGTKRIAAELHFTPVSTADVPVARTQVTTTTDAPLDDSNAADPQSSANMMTNTSDFSVQLLRGVTYHVLVEPTDTSLPPYSLEFTADGGKSLAIDYSKVRWTVQRFFVQDAPADVKLVMRAVDAQTGEPVSNSAKVTDAPATLVFGPAPAPEFRLELTAPESYATAAPEPAQNPGADADAGMGDMPECDHTTPVFPVLRIAQNALKDDETGTHVLVMPKIPETIDYAGVVQLCEGNGIKGLAGMPMALDARTLLLDGDPNIEASYNATTTATLHEPSGELRFCTRVLPGDYVVVITPPVNVACEIFAETRHIDAPEGGQIGDVLLTLRAAAELRGTVETPDRTPLGAASIEAHALGRYFTIGKDDPSVPSYNRSTQATTDATGRFQIPIDIGSYDVVFKPAPDSDFAWQLLYDVDIDTPSDVFSTKVVLSAPIVIDGKLSYAGATKQAQLSLASADVHAYLKVESVGGTRTIEVARSVADDEGNVTLLISPQPHQGR